MFKSTPNEASALFAESTRSDIQLSSPDDEDPDVNATPNSRIPRYSHTMAIIPRPMVHISDSRRLRSGLTANFAKSMLTDDDELDCPNASFPLFGCALPKPLD